MITHNVCTLIFYHYEIIKAVGTDDKFDKMLIVIHQFFTHQNFPDPHLSLLKFYTYDT